MDFTIASDISSWNAALETLLPTCEATFQRLQVNVAALKALKASSNETEIDLTFLSPLNDNFIPQGKIFVRDCMRNVFERFQNFDPAKKAILVGSQGVGKSLLSFLAALQLAFTQAKPVGQTRTITFQSL